MIKPKVVVNFRLPLSLKERAGRLALGVVGDRRREGNGGARGRTAQTQVIAVLPVLVEPPVGSGAARPRVRPNRRNSVIFPVALINAAFSARAFMVDLHAPAGGVRSAIEFGVGNLTPM